jgi:hypothetical protein
MSESERGTAVSRNLNNALSGHQEKLSLGIESPGDYYHLLKLCEKAIFELQKKEEEAKGYKKALFDQGEK